MDRPWKIRHHVEKKRLSTTKMPAILLNKLLGSKYFRYSHPSWYQTVQLSPNSWVIQSWAQCNYYFKCSSLLCTNKQTRILFGKAWKSIYFLRVYTTVVCRVVHSQNLIWGEWTNWLVRSIFSIFISENEFQMYSYYTILPKIPNRNCNFIFDDQ